MLASMAGTVRRTVEDLTQFAKETSYDGKPLSKDPMLRQKLADMAIGVQVARLFVYRVVWMQGKGLIPTYHASVAKVFSDELNFRISQLGTEMMGLYGQLDRGSKWAPFGGAMSDVYLSSLGSLFAGGTPEIQRGVIATVGLGLPRR
jgi:hypothetical protein